MIPGNSTSNAAPTTTSASEVGARTSASAPIWQRWRFAKCSGELATRVPDIHLDGDVSYLRSNFIGGIKRMPVAFTPSTSRHTKPMERLGSAAGVSGDHGYGARSDRPSD